ncbi:MAG: hypothetical protein Q7S45_00870 [Candidatus Curtissbacteria bacterium]|nr:hypothetical protein [Candidatus Curtissbacteria bacterium]
MRGERLTLETTPLEAISQMAENNVGAQIACLKLLANGDAIDPGLSPDAGFIALLYLDELNVWGERLNKFWQDVCNQDEGVMFAILRAYQLGELVGVNQNTIDHAIANHGDGINTDAVIAAVKEYLPNFNPAARAHST